MAGGGARSAPYWHVNEPKNTGAPSARARTRGQNPLVINTSLAICKEVQYSRREAPQAGLKPHNGCIFGMIGKTGSPITAVPRFIISLTGLSVTTAYITVTLTKRVHHVCMYPSFKYTNNCEHKTKDFLQILFPPSQFASFIFLYIFVL
jgi:hypothetical protein